MIDHHRDRMGGQGMEERFLRRRARSVGRDDVHAEQEGSRLVQSLAFLCLAVRWLTNACAAAAWGLLGGHALLAADAGRDDSAVTLSTSLKIPGRHPYLLVTRAEVDQAKRRAERSAPDRATLETLVKQGRELAAKPLEKLPEKGDTAHWGIAERLVQVGLAQAFSGDPQLAEWVRDGLLAYADVYPSLPLTRMRCKVFSQSSLYEAMWAENMAWAYDLVADSGTLTAEQRQHVERDLLRAAVECFRVTDLERDPRIRDLHYRCYNFQAWHLGAIGLIGLALRDGELVDYAINSRYGFGHLVAHDIRDDGLFWERSQGYHRFVLTALLPLTEALLRCGVDLYQVRVPNDRSADEDCHYVTDTSPAPKSLRMMFQAPFYVAFPDLSYIALGDSDRGPQRPDWMTLVAWNRYRSMPYESHWKTEWTSHTLSHNTLVVDELSQRPAGEKNLMWPVDSSADRVLGTLARFDADAKLVSARCASAYPGLILLRQVRLWQSCVVDSYDVQPDPDAALQQPAGEHQFDYVLHVDGQWDSGSVPLEPRSGPLGSQCGYQLVEKARSAEIRKPAQLTFLAGATRCRLWILPQGSPLEVIVAEAPTDKPDEREPIVILRQRGTAARFRTLFEPLGERPLDERTVSELSP